MIGDLDVPIGGYEVDDSVAEGDRALDGLDGEWAVPAQDLLEMAGARGIQVLSDDDRGREVCFKTGGQPDKRVDAASGCADDDEIGNARFFGHCLLRRLQRACSAFQATPLRS